MPYAPHACSHCWKKVNKTSTADISGGLIGTSSLEELAFNDGFLAADAVLVVPAGASAVSVAAGGGGAAAFDGGASSWAAAGRLRAAVFARCNPRRSNSEFRKSFKPCRVTCPFANFSKIGRRKAAASFTAG